jgi:hypothetical protein
MKNSSAMSMEQVMALYFNDKAIRSQPRPVRRIDTPHGRYYASLNSTNTEIVYVPSVTTIIKQTSQMPYHLLNWYVQHGWERAEQLKNESADYGTLMHITIANYLTSKRLNLGAIPLLIEQYVTQNKIQYDTSAWNQRLRQDILSFHTFAVEYRIEPIAIEMPLVSSRHGFGGAIDLVCEATFRVKGFHGEVYKTGERKGQPKETFAEQTAIVMIDFKSGRHGFYEEHEVQVDGFYRVLWNEHFPDLQVTRCFNWSPKEWTDEPGFRFTEQTGKSSMEEALLHLRKFKMRYAKAPYQVTEIEGTIELGTPASETTIRRNSILTILRREWEEQGIMTPRQARTTVMPPMVDDEPDFGEPLDTSEPVVDNSFASLFNNEN